eukprot:TRINITY_DN8354_c0_g1_i1.p1 TRINITY_DN8354_c0_g1~~TRINITY_DN8354_c0_g1_i1.p1  ORF type:complete len:217 (-),score=62.77 TRINITY_DN8354_c0_g1_i1:121-771(-)
MVVYRLLICEEKKGVCFVDLTFTEVVEIGQKQEKLKATALDMSKMILTYYQLSRTFGDGGDEAHICFEEKIVDQGKMRIPSGMSRSFNSRRQRFKPKMIHLYTIKVNSLISALFVDDKAPENSVKIYLKDVLEEFEKQCKAQLTELIPTIPSLSDTDFNEVRNQFRSFEETANKLRETRFGGDDPMESNRTVETDESDLTDEDDDEDLSPKLEHLS